MPATPFLAVCFPNMKHSYVDWNTLSLLFSLMAVMKGFQKFGLFDYLGSSLLKKVFSTRATLLVLIFLPFAFSMLITNDVSLITFVPFSIIVLSRIVAMSFCEPRS